MQSIKNIVGKEFNTAKGVITVTEFNEFNATLFNKKVLSHKMRRIQGKKHKIGTYEINKISLSCFDYKIFVIDDGIHTLAYYHEDFRKQILTDYQKEGEIQEILIKKKRFSQMITNKDRCVQINSPQVG